MATADIIPNPEDQPQVAPEAPVEILPEVIRPEPPAPSLGWDETVVTRPIGFGWNSEAIVVDWEGNGRADLLVTASGGSQGRSTRLYRVTSPVGEFPPKYDAGTPVEGLDGLQHLGVFSSGSETRFDLVGVSLCEGLVLVRNTGTATSPKFESRESLGVGADLGMGEALIAQVVAIDWDGDKLVDLLIGYNDIEGYWPDALPVAQQVGFNRLAGHPGYDRDGNWRGRAPIGRIRWLKNVGSVGSPKFELQDELQTETGPLSLELNPAALAVSWGGGSAVELLTTDRRGDLKLYRNFGGQRPPVLMEPRSLQVSGKSLLLPEDRTSLMSADLDGDRRVELLYGTASGSIHAVHAAPGRDTAQPPVTLEQAAGELYLGGHTVLTTADLDSDGGLDLIVGDAAGWLTWFKDVGEGPTHRYKAGIRLEASGLGFKLDPGPDGRLNGPVAPSLGFAAPTIADWDNNGRLDLILGGAGGEILWFKNDGAKYDPRFAIPFPMVCAGAPVITPPRVRPATSHWTGSEHLDLIAIDLQGFLCVYPGKGTNELEPPLPIVDTLGRLIRLDGGFGQNGRVTLWSGDFTGNGQPDILVGLASESRYVLPSLLGKGVQSFDSLSTVLLLENVGHNTVVAKLITLADGSPIVIGAEGCSPSGVLNVDGTLDLIVGSDSGSVRYFRRSELAW